MKIETWKNVILAILVLCFGISTVFMQLSIRSQSVTIELMKQTIAIQRNTIERQNNALKNSIKAMENAKEEMDAQGRTVRRLSELCR